MAKLTLTDLSSLTNETSAITTINANNALIEEALEITLSRNGLSPNVMSDDLDMNSFRILNTPAPVDDNDLVRLIDVAEGIRGEKGDTGDPGGPLADGDYGDVVVSSTGTVWTLATAITDEISDATTAIAGLGDSATLDIGFIADTVAEGNDPRFYKYGRSLRNGDYSITAAETSTPTFIWHTSGFAHAYTIAPYASIPYEEGVQVTIINSITAGAITLTRGAGVTLYANGSTTSANVTMAPGAVCTLINVQQNEWVALGAGLS